MGQFYTEPDLLLVHAQLASPPIPMVSLGEQICQPRAATPFLTHPLPYLTMKSREEVIRE